MEQSPQTSGGKSVARRFWPLRHLLDFGNGLPTGQHECRLRGQLLRGQSRTGRPCKNFRASLPQRRHQVRPACLRHLAAATAPPTRTWSPLRAGMACGLPRWMPNCVERNGRKASRSIPSPRCELLDTPRGAGTSQSRGTQNSLSRQPNPWFIHVRASKSDRLHLCHLEHRRTNSFVSEL